VNAYIIIIIINENYKHYIIYIVVDLLIFLEHHTFSKAHVITTLFYSSLLVTLNKEKKMGFGDLKTRAGQQALNNYLADRSYIEGL
jgi:hypothetical protein